MTLRELHKRLGEIIASNERECRPERNDLPVHFALWRDGARQEPWYTPVSYVYGGQLTYRNTKGENVYCIGIIGHEKETVKPSARRNAAIAAQTDAQICKGAAFSVHDGGRYASFTLWNSKMVAALFVAWLKSQDPKLNPHRSRNTDAVWADCGVDQLRRLAVQFLAEKGIHRTEDAAGE